ncbi:MAG: pantoate--beta-alanine ligase, partial [Syntrophomonadaceae bacterium]|nr:pantoate--beta-alanine ligase [Syntrophomonadaceae bacterium]
ERPSALTLSQALELGRAMIEQGERDPGVIRQAMIDHIQAAPFTSIDYVQICNGDDLSDLDTVQGRVLLALAVRVGTTRLIDNLLLEV